MSDINDRYDDIYNWDEEQEYLDYLHYLIDIQALEDEAQEQMEQGIPF